MATSAKTASRVNLFIEYYEGDSLKNVFIIIGILIKAIIIITNIMTKTISLFLPNKMYEELLYQYEGKDPELRKLVFAFLTPLGKQAKMVNLGGSMQVKVYKGDKITMENKNLKEVDLEKFTPKFDKAWIPEKVTKDEIKVYTQPVSNRLFDDLVNFAKVFCARLDIYNLSLDKKHKEYKERVAIFPACFEQIIQDNVVSQLSQTIGSNIDKEYDTEFAEMEKNIEDKKKKTAPRTKE